MGTKATHTFTSSIREKINMLSSKERIICIWLYIINRKSIFKIHNTFVLKAHLHAETTLQKMGIFCKSWVLELTIYFFNFRRSVEGLKPVAKMWILSAQTPSCLKWNTWSSHYHLLTCTLHEFLHILCMLTGI